MCYLLRHARRDGWRLRGNDCNRWTVSRSSSLYPFVSSTPRSHFCVLSPFFIFCFFSSSSSVNYRTGLMSSVVLSVIRPAIIRSIPFLMTSIFNSCGHKMLIVSEIWYVLCFYFLFISLFCYLSLRFLPFVFRSIFWNTLYLSLCIIFQFTFHKCGWF